MYDEFEKRDIVVVAVAQEEKKLADHAKTVGRFPEAPFFIVADVNHEKTRPYSRTTAYFIDKSGTVRQVFPMEIYNRPSWWAILNEVDRILGD